MATAHHSRGALVFVCAGVVATLLLPPPPFGAAATAAGAGLGSNCTRSCGNISIPYPFGIEHGCYHAPGFNLTCRKHSRGHAPPELFLGDGTVNVLDISLPNGTVRIRSPCVELTDDADGRTAMGTWGAGLPQGGLFFLSEETNNVAVVGCDVQVHLRGGMHDDFISSCSAVCPPVGGGIAIGNFNGACTGIGCCQSNIIVGYSFYNVQIYKFNSTFDDSSEYSVYIADGIFNTTDADAIRPFHPEALPAMLEWRISNLMCPENTSAPECRSAHSYCQDSQADDHTGYRCRCSDGYGGNPYVIGGCQDIDECKYPDIYHCYGDCKNTPGSFICGCHTGFIGNASIPNGCTDIDECEQPEAYLCYGVCLNLPGSFQCGCPDGTHGNPMTKDGCIAIENSFTGLIIALGVGGGTCILLLALAGPFIIRKIKLRKMKKVKQKFFNQNHGLLLQQLISHNTDIGERMIISLTEVEKATNNFDMARVVGGGGHGVVYKGILDLHVVAIKKSKIVVQREINEFINEVVVLSQLNHRNVVKLLGCCLETEVPLLVYEFISNGTLYDHLHVERPISLPWDDRVRIAMEIARALSYLHSAASMPIFHRDIKSSNILLDETLTAKVSDFGASRYIPIDKTGITTAVQGTIGYLDPMYYYTGRLTDKSDVFSFGVLVIELLTRKKPFVYRSNDGDCLVSHFVSLLGEGKLIDIIDPQVVEEEEGQILQKVGDLAAMCTKLKGEDRPTMREVEMELENLLIKKKHVPCDTTRKYENENVAYKPMEHIRKESSRQYTMEEEILLSASYPR